MMTRWLAYEAAAPFRKARGSAVEAETKFGAWLHAAGWLVLLVLVGVPAVLRHLA